MRIPALLLAFGLALPAGAQTLTGAEWRVVDLAGGGLSPDVAPTLAFGPDGRLSGYSGCNRFVGTWAQDGAALVIGPLAATRMACPPDRMALEQRLLAALAQVRSLALTPGGALELLGDSGLAIRAVRP